MSNMWDLGGEEFNPNAGEFDMGGGFDTVPEGVYFATINEAEWREFEDGTRVINIQWRITGGEHDRRVIFQKLKVKHEDKKKRIKAVKMLMAINANAGSVLPLDREPGDTDLMNLTGASMYLDVKIWEMNDSTGNWVNKVSKAKPQPQPTAKAGSQTHDDVPF